MSFWLVVGAKKNWLTAFEYKNIWGLRKAQRHLWENLNEGDKVPFYVTSPVSGIIGYVIVRTKMIQDKPLWPDELKGNKVIWPLRFEFDVVFCLPLEKWKFQKLSSKLIWPRAGFQILSENTGQELISNLEENQCKIPTYETPMVAEKPTQFVSVSNKKEEVIPTHDELQKNLSKSETFKVISLSKNIHLT